MLLKELYLVDPLKNNCHKLINYIPFLSNKINKQIRKTKIRIIRWISQVYRKYVVGIVMRYT